MYYSISCAHCSKVFYTFNDDKGIASQTLYAGLEQHMKDYKESEDDSFYHEGELDTNRIYSEMSESSDAPSGGYQL